MTFRIKKGGEAIRWPVPVEAPQDGGRTQTQTFYAQFVVLDQERIDELVGDDHQFMMAAIQGWQGVLGEDSAEMPFSEETLAAMLRIPYVKRALVQAYFAFVAGVGSKNSRAPRGTG